MRIGIAVTLKADDVAGKPDDWQEEFDSPATVAGLRAAIEAGGHTVVELGDGRAFVEALLRDPPDLVFNIAEGAGTSRSREARVPAVCEMLGIPCTGSDPLTLAAGLDKDVARRLVASAGVPVPHGILVHRIDQLDDSSVTYPAIVKPAWEGSSKGVRGKCVVHDPAELRAALPGLLTNYEQPVLVEEFIAGDEVTVGVLGNDPPRVIGSLQVVPKKPTAEFVYSLEVKRDWENQVRYQCPPALDAGTVARLEANALTAYRALGCRDIARVDFRIRSGTPYFLEANPLPGLNPVTGDIVIAAKAMGMTHTDLVQGIINAAVVRG
ncbi:MAG: D-alanine--D-alanine ligase [Gemmataceae bacterium]|nr:D-alanine--D-alanine ligase [Gemmataceae bacterium]